MAVESIYASPYRKKKGKPLYELPLSIANKSNNNLCVCVNTMARYLWQQ